MSSVEISDSTVDNEQPAYVAAAGKHLSIILGQVPQTGLIKELHVITSLSTPALITLITRATLPATCTSGICPQLFCCGGIQEVFPKHTFSQRSSYENSTFISYFPRSNHSPSQL